MIMSELHIRCATPTMSDADDKLSSIYSTESQYQCSPPTDSPVQDRRALQEDPIDWWGTYVPLESWIPPKPESIPTFQGIIGLESYPVYKCKFTITPIRPGILKTFPLQYISSVPSFPIIMNIGVIPWERKRKVSHLLDYWRG